MRGAVLVMAVLAASAGAAAAQSADQLAQVDTMRSDLVTCIGFAKAADTQWTKWAEATDTATARVEGVRSRGFVRAVITQCTKPLAILDALLGTTTPAEPPDTTTAPEPPPADTVTVPPDTTPAPPPSDPGDAFYAEDFEGYAVGALMNTRQPASGVRWNPNGGAVTASSDRAHSGSMSMRLRFDHDWAEQRFRLPATYDELWIEYYLWTPQEYDHVQDGSSDNNKFFRLWHGNYNDSQCLEGASTWPTGDGSSRLRFDYTRIGNSSAGPGASPSASWGTPDMRGRWVQVRHHYRYASASGGALMQVWADGRLILDFHADQRVESCGGWNAGYFLGATNATFRGTLDFYIDDLKFWATNPGW